MRYIILFLLFSSPLFAQKELPRGTSGLVEFTEVVKVAGLSKGGLLPVTNRRMLLSLRMT